MVESLNENIEAIHYTVLHTALEQYLAREIDGSLTRVEYPSEGVKKGFVKLHFTEVADNGSGE